MAAPPPTPTLPAALRALADPLASQVAPTRFARRAASVAASAAASGVNAVRLVRRRELHRAVLTEEEYTAHLEHVIQRQYFPDLPKLQQQRAWLEALDSGDPRRVAQARAELSASVRRHDRMVSEAEDSTPAVLGLGGTRAVLAAGATPAGVGAKRHRDDAATVVSALPDSASVMGGAPKRPRASLRPGDAAAPPTLDAFHATFTSEDNASFGVNMDARQQVQRRRHWWLYEHVSGRKLRMMLTDGNAARAVGAAIRDDSVHGVDLLTDSSGGAALKQDPHGLVRSWRHRPTNALFFPPNLHVSNAISGVTNPAPHPSLDADAVVPMAALADAPAGGALVSSARMAGLLLADDRPRLGRATASTLLLTDGAVASSTTVNVGGMDLIVPHAAPVLRPDGGVAAPPTVRIQSTRLDAPTLRKSLAPVSLLSQVVRPAKPHPDAPRVAVRSDGVPEINGYALVTSPAFEADVAAAAADLVLQAADARDPLDSELLAAHAASLQTPVIPAGSTNADGTRVLGGPDFLLQPERQREALAERLHAHAVGAPSGGSTIPTLQSHAAATSKRTTRPVFAAATPALLGTPSAGGGGDARSVASGGTARTGGTTRSRAAALSPAAQRLMRVVAKQHTGSALSGSGSSSSGGGGGGGGAATSLLGGHGIGAIAGDLRKGY